MNTTEIILIAAIATIGLLYGEVMQFIDRKRRHEE